MSQAPHRHTICLSRSATFRRGVMRYLKGSPTSLHPSVLLRSSLQVMIPERSNIPRQCPRIGRRRVNRRSLENEKGSPGITQEKGAKWEAQQTENRAIYSNYLNLCGLNGAPGAIRTPGPQIRSLMLYPAELRVHGVGDLAGRAWVCKGEK